MNFNSCSFYLLITKKRLTFVLSWRRALRRTQKKSRAASQGIHRKSQRRKTSSRHVGTCQHNVKISSLRRESHESRWSSKPQRRAAQDHVIWDVKFVDTTVQNISSLQMRLYFVTWRIDFSWQYLSNNHDDLQAAIRWRWHTRSNVDVKKRYVELDCVLSVTGLEVKRWENALASCDRKRDYVMWIRTGYFRTCGDAICQKKKVTSPKI